MDPVIDNDLLWIAREGLKAPLPSAWKPCKTDTDEVYYFNFDTGESVWEHPCDEYYKQLFINEKQKKQQKIINKSINNKPINNVLNNKTNTIPSNTNKLGSIQLGGSLNKFKPLGSVSGINEITPKAGIDNDMNDIYEATHETESNKSLSNSIQVSKTPVQKSLSSTVSTSNLFSKPLISSTNKQTVNDNNIDSSLELSADVNPLQLDSPTSKQIKLIDSPAIAAATTSTTNKPKVTIIPSSNKSNPHTNGTDAIQTAMNDADADKLDKLKQIEIDKLLYIKQLESEYELYTQSKQDEYNQQKQQIQQQHDAELSVINKLHSSKLFDKQTQLDHDISVIDKLSTEHKNKKSTLQQQLNELNHIVSDNQRKLNQLRSEHNNAEQKLIDEFDTIKSKHEINQQSLQQELHTLHQSIDNKRDELNALNRQHDEETEELHHKHTQHIDDMKHHHTKQLIELQQHNQNEIDSLKAKHSADLQHIHSIHTALLNDTGNAADQITQLRTQLNNSQHRYDQLQVDRSIAEQKLIDLQHQHQAQIDEMNNKLQHAQSQQLDGLSDEVRILRAQITDNAVELQHTQSERDTHLKTINKLRSELNSRISSATDHTAIVRLNNEIDTLKQQLSDAKNELSEHKLCAMNIHHDTTHSDQLNQLIEQLAELQMQSSTQTEQYQATRNLMQKSIDKLQSQLQQSNSELQQLRSTKHMNGIVKHQQVDTYHNDDKVMHDDELMLHEIDDLDDAVAHNKQRSTKHGQRAHSTTRLDSKQQRIAWQQQHHNISNDNDNDIGNSDSDAVINHRTLHHQPRPYISSDVDSVSTRDLSELHFLSERKEKQRNRSKSHKSRKSEYYTNTNNQVYKVWTNKISIEHNVLQAVHDYVSNEKLHIKQLMKQLNDQQIQWKSDKHKYNDKYSHHINNESIDKQKKFTKLKQTKKQLDDEAKLLNNEIRQLRSMQQWLDKQDYKLIQFTSQLNRVMRNVKVSELDTSVEYEMNSEIELYWNEYIGDINEYNAYVNSAAPPTSITTQPTQHTTIHHQRFHTLQQPLVTDQYNNKILSSTHGRTHSAATTAMYQSNHPLSNTVLPPNNTTYAVDQPMSVQDRTDVQQRVNVLQNMLNRWSTTTTDINNKQTLDTHTQWLTQFEQKVKSIPSTPLKPSLHNTNNNTQAITIPKQHASDKDIVIRITRE